MERIRNKVKNDKNFWYPLDNAAKIYPAITTDELTCVFRISAILKQKIKIKTLFETVRQIESRFPYYKVKLKRGFFWYYLESAEFTTSVDVDNKIPCRSFNKNQSLIRILVVNNRISVEFSHLLTDGSGAFEYLKTLLACYFELTGVEIPSSFTFLHPKDIPNPEEFEDSFNRYFNEDIPVSVGRPKAFHLPFPLKHEPRLSVLNAIISIDEIKAKASEKGVSITVYLTAVYLFILQEIYESLSQYNRHRKLKKLSIEVPINLRKIYPTATMRNFSLFVMPEIDLGLGHYSFDEIIKTVYLQIQLETDEKLLNKIMARNVGGERKFIVRSIPLFLKSFLLRLLYNYFGSNQYSGVLTNLGGTVFPKQINDQVDYLVFTPPPPNKMEKVSCGIIGFNGKLVISFCNISKTKELEKRFIKFLVKQDIRVKITT